MIKKLVVLIVAISCMMVWAEVEWSFYGNARFNTWMRITKANPDADSESELLWKKCGGSRFGGRASIGDFAGRFEYGSSGSSPNLRLIYGQWNITEDVNFLLGQGWAPTNYFPSNMNSLDGSALLNYGGFLTSRQEMLQLSIKGFSLALINPKSFTGVEYKEIIDTSTTSLVGTNKTIIPKIEAAYNHSADAFHIGAVVGFAPWKYEYDMRVSGGDSAIEESQTFMALVACLDAGFSAGPLYVNVNANYCINRAAYGGWFNGDAKPAIEQEDNTKAEFTAVNASSIGVVGVVGIKATDNVQPEFGIGYLQHTRGTKAEEALTDGGKDPCLALYGQCVFTFGDGQFQFMPEFGYGTKMKGMSGQDEDTEMEIGAYTRINF